MSTLIAFHGDPAVKEKYIARVRAHRLADDIVRGIGWKEGRGCAVGCTLEAYEHERYEPELGIPQALARLEDAIFEGVHWKSAPRWPEEFLQAIPVGADLSRVVWQFFRWAITASPAAPAFELGGMPALTARCLEVLEPLSNGYEPPRGLAHAVGEVAAEARYSTDWLALRGAPEAAAGVICVLMLAVPCISKPSRRYSEREIARAAGRAAHSLSDVSALLSQGYEETRTPEGREKFHDTRQACFSAMGNKLLSLLEEAGPPTQIMSTQHHPRDANGSEVPCE
jgi:hypothetical protein